MTFSGSSIWPRPSTGTPPKSAPHASATAVLRNLYGHHLLCMAALVGLAAAVRGPYVSESLWIDELHTAWTISGTWREIARRAAQGNNFPLYFWCERLLMEGLGASAGVLRLISLISGLALIPAAWLCLRSWWKNSALSEGEQRLLSCLVGAWIALDDNFIFFGLEARPYAVAQFVALCLLGLLPQLLLAPTWPRRAQCIVLQTLLFYLHPTNALLVPATFAARWLGSPSRRGVFQACVLDSLLTFALWLPAAPLLWEIYGRRGNWATIPSLAPAAATLDRWWNLVHLPVYVGLPLLALLASWGWQLVRAGRSPWARRLPIPRQSPLAPQSAMPPKLWSARFGTDAATLPSHGEHAQPCWEPAAGLRAAVTVTACWAAIPVTIVWITTRCDWAALLLLRYVWSSATAPLLLGVLLLSQIRSQVWRWGACCVALGLAWQSYGPQRLGDSRTGEPWEEVLQSMQFWDPTAAYPVLVRANLIEATFLPAEMPAEGADSAGEEQSAGETLHRQPATDGPSWRAYNVLPFHTETYPTKYPLAQLVPLDNRLPPTWPAELERQLDSPAVWLVARGQAHVTEELADCVERRLSQHRSNWHRVLDEVPGKVRLVLWRRAAEPADPAAGQPR